MAAHSSILAGESHKQRRLAGYHPWGCKELDRTERLIQHNNNTKRPCSERKLVSRGWGRRGGRSYTELQFCKMEIPGDLLHTNANIIQHY